MSNKSHFIFSGHDTINLANEYGTPLYILSEDIIRKNVMDIIKSYKRQDIDFQVVYAGKALLNIAMCRIVKDLGLGLDVVSSGELYTAKKASFPMDNVFFHGNNKSIDELKMAIDLDVARVIIDNEYELSLLNTLSIERNKKTQVLFRITPGVEAHTHKYIQTGQEDSKFGISIKEAEEIIVKASKMDGIHVKGLHCHIGSQILEERPYEIVSEIMLKFIKKLKKQNDIEIDELNLGGGFGISYSPEKPFFKMDQMINKISSIIKNKSMEFNIKIPKIIIEPGRYIVGNAGITLYEVGAVKDIPNIRKYVSINGGMTDNPRTALYDAKYSALLANKMDYKNIELVSISGKCCESGDMLIWDISLPHCEPGDILAVLSTGAYNYSMSSNYNRIPRPSMILLKGDKAEVMVEGETLDDIIRNDKIPSWL
jgi:diaminopimelate decarboxylase